MVAGIEKKLSFVGAAIQKLKAEVETEQPPYKMDVSEIAVLTAYAERTPDAEQQYSDWIGEVHPFGVNNPWLNQAIGTTYRALGLRPDSTDSEWAEAYQTHLDRFNRRNRMRGVL